MALEGDSPEIIALELLRSIARSENKKFDAGLIVDDRKWILDAYAECLQATKNIRKF